MRHRNSGWSYVPALHIFLMVLCAGELPALGQKAPAAEAQTSQTDCLDDTKCSELYENARQLSQAGQYEAALVAYQSAYARRPSSWLLINIGRMQQRLGRPQQALVTYKRFLSDPSVPADEESRKKANDFLQQAERDIEEQRRSLAPPPPASPPPPPAPLLEKTPVYKKWWFWTAIGGTVAVAAVGIGVGLGLRSLAASAPPSVPQGVSVYDTGF